MPKTKYATLVFSDGRLLTVTVAEEGWPPVIEHTDIKATGATHRDKTLVVREKVVKFRYYGCQYGIGAYVEQP
jgi:hypothetical protein